MLSLLQRFRARFHEIEQALHRLEAAQAEDRLAAQRLLQEVQQLKQVQNDARDETNQGISHIRGIAEHTQLLSGNTLAAVNDYRLHGMAVADLARQAIGRIETRQIVPRPETSRSWQENEFRVYSQFGEDGLLQYLFRHLPHAPHVFVEFGVEDYKEANTRFLLLNDRSWAGLVMDGSEENVAAIRQDPAYLRFNLKVAAAWIGRDNINDLLIGQGFEGEIGLLSIDIDGNDFWVWDAITAVSPVVVVIEYNYRFGAENSVVVPYDPLFDKGTAHPSGIYYGSSLKALTVLAEHKGYTFVGCSTGGVNAFFVRRDCLTTAITEVSVEEGYVAGHHAEMREPETGIQVKAALEEQMRLLLTLPLETVDRSIFSGVRS